MFVAVTQEFILAQTLVVLFTAVNAFMMIVRDRKINIGTHDWKLLLFVFGTPIVTGVVGIAVGYLGPSGAW